MDTRWTDLFWHFRSSEDRIDEIYMSFLNRFFLNLRIANTSFKPEKIIIEDLYKMLSTADKKGNKTDCHYQSMSIYNDVLTKECIGELTACLNNLCRQYEKLTEDYGKEKAKQAMDELFWPYWKLDEDKTGNTPFYFIPHYKKTENNKTDNSETDLIYPAELQEEEQYRRYFKEALELEILEQGYPADKAVLYEILELLVETVTSRKKFLRICGEEKPKEVVKSRLMKLDSSHIQYILECLKENSTQIRNIKQYLLATLYNAPVTVDSYYSAQVRHEFGWGSRVDKN